ncbi:strawberry notch C-terminal domain-containing protein [Acinetobacter indicus]|uniref:strawberry notch C-terminal domain-containing protein n=1 Tax=Acinetobacter TaxID=469 RepID=UPI0015D103DA|nr:MULTISPECIES: strawberry notch C-terminal domain-containing protein [Acinetobacter]MCP0917678.1 strawberry notch C-terminal domain-containing protein [Acinetobacter indicus]
MTNESEITMKWIDMSSAGIYLFPQTLANQKKVLLLLDCNNILPTENLATYGFERLYIENADQLSQRLYMRDKSSGVIQPQIFVKIGVSHQLIRIINATQEYLTDQFNTQFSRYTKYSLSQLLNTKTPLARNSLGDMVFASPFGRFSVNDENGTISVEKRDISGNIVSDPRFLRAKLRGEVYSCVQGFLDYKIELKQNISNADLINFTALITQKGNTSFDVSQVTSTQLDLVQDALEMAVVAKYSILDLNDKAHFEVAVQVFEQLPIRNLTNNVVLSLQQITTPLPLAFIGQRLLIDKEKFENTDTQFSLLEPCLGHASLVAMLSMYKNIDIFGFEIDNNRLSRLQKTDLHKSLQVHSGNSKDINFVDHNGTKLFDFVISNLPCDRIERTEIGTLRSHPNEIFKTTRLDYLLLFRSLRSREEDGRSVFFFSTDAPISHGEIKASTQLMLYYLYENYHVDDLVEVSGELYARQGAKYNVRILVVGKKRDVPIADRDLLAKLVPSQLKFFNDYQDLWLWSNRLIEKRYGEDEFDLSKATEVNVYGNSETNNNFNERFVHDLSDNESLEQVATITPIISPDQREIEDFDDSALQNIMGNEADIQSAQEAIQTEKVIPDIFDDEFDDDEDLLADKDDDANVFSVGKSSREDAFDAISSEEEKLTDKIGNSFFDQDDQDADSNDGPGDDFKFEDDDAPPSDDEDDFDPSNLDGDDFDPADLEESTASIDTGSSSGTGSARIAFSGELDQDHDDQESISIAKESTSTASSSTVTGASTTVEVEEDDHESEATEPEEVSPAAVFGFDEEEVDLDALETSDVTEEIVEETPKADLFNENGESEGEQETKVESNDTEAKSEPESEAEQSGKSNLIETDKEIVRIAGDSNQPSSTIIKSLDEAVLYEENNYQQKYISESRVSETISMIPKNLAPSFYRARDALVEYLELSVQSEIQETLTDATGAERIFVGSNRFYSKEFADYVERTNFQSMIDAYVGYMLQYETHEELAECFACEQVDALALAISQHKSNRAIWIGDQTGLGKGRVAAGLLRYAKLQGLRPAFFTLNAQLFGDIWRDITAIKADKLFKNPFIFNANASISDFGTTNELFKGTSIPKDLKTISDDHDLVLATYSQFGKSGQKPNLLIDAVNANTFLVLDESHKAAGEKSHINKIFTQIIGQASSLAYSSATGIKTANNLPFYYRLFPASISREVIMTTLKDADEAVLELVSHNLSMDGCLVRREQDLSKIEFITPEPNKEYNEYVYQLSDALSAILLDMNELSTSLMDDLNDHFVEAGDPEQFIVNMFRKEHPKAKFNFSDAKLGLKVNMLNFASRLYDVQRQFLLAIKTGSAIETAINCLNNGQKPVISLESTGESVFNRLMAYKLNTPDAEGQTLADLENEIARLQMQIKHAEENDKVTTKLQKELDRYVNRRSERIKEYLADFDHPPLFKEILMMMLDSMNKAKITDEDGNYIELVVGDGNPAYDEQRELIRKKINGYPDLPFMPIDIMRNEIRKAGFTVDEIAGTTVRLLQNQETGRWYAETRKSNDIGERVRIVADFQSGKLDALIITRSGSTGISLHALESKNPDIPSDHLRQRVLIVAQLPLEIVEFMQTLGRVDRRGQYSSPQIITLSSCIPAENRINMMHMRKLALLSANTTSNRESRYKETDDMPDMLNEVGNKVCVEYLTENPEIATTFGIDISEDKDKKNERDKSKYINKLLSKLIMVPIHQQEMIFQDLSAKFNEYVKELEAAGRNPLRVQVLNWKAKDLSVHQLKRGALDVSVRNHFGLETAFDHELTYKQVGYSQDMRPIRTNKFSEIFKASEDAMLKQLAVLLGKGPEEVTQLSTAILEYADKLDSLIVDKYVASCRSSVINAEGEFIILANKETSRLVQEYFKRDTDPNNHRDLNIKATKQSIRDALEVINNQKLIESFENAQLIIKTLKDFARCYRSDDAEKLNRHGLVLPMYCPTLDGESMISGGVLARIFFPPIRTNSLIPSAFKFDVIFPGEDDVVQVSLSYLFSQSTAVVQSCKYIQPSNDSKEIRLQIMDKRAAKDKQREYDEPKQPVYMVYYNIEDTQEKLLKTSFDSAHEGRVNRTANIVSGNLFKAKTLMDKNVPHCSIIYTNQYGIRERGFLVSPKFTYAALEDSIYRTATTEQISIYLEALKEHAVNYEDYPKIQFNARNTSVLIEFQSPSNATMTVKGASADINRFLEDESIFKTEMVDKPKSLNIVISGDVIARGARTLRIAKVSWDNLPKLITLMGENGHFINAEISHFHPEPLQTARERLDKFLNRDFAILSKHHIVSSGSTSNKLEEVKQSEDGVTDALVNNVGSLFSA